jgi:hypothetical protein
MQVSDISSNWRLESSSGDRSKSTSGQLKSTGGNIFDDAGNHVAHYYATLSPLWKEKRVILYIGFLERDRKYKKRKKNDVVLELWRQEGEVMTRDVSDLDFVRILLNHPLSREEAPKIPPTPLFSKFKDFILENDPYIRPFLNVDSTPEAPEEKQE